MNRIINSTSTSNPSLPAIKALPIQNKSVTARVGHTAKRLLNALMRSLATPHI